MDTSRIDDSNKFWNIIENKMGCIVPKYIRNILRLRGFDDPVSISTITKDDIEAFKKFAKTIMKDMIPAGADPLEYYFHTAYAETPQTFEIAPGHVNLLVSIVQFIKEQTVIHGHQYFNFHSTEAVKPMKDQGKSRAGKLNKSSKNFLLIKSRLKTCENQQRMQTRTYFILNLQILRQTY